MGGAKVLTEGIMGEANLSSVTQETDKEFYKRHLCSKFLGLSCELQMLDKLASLQRILRTLPNFLGPDSFGMVLQLFIEIEY